jgi:hypothetical protein
MHSEVHGSDSQDDTRYVNYVQHLTTCKLRIHIQLRITLHQITSYRITSHVITSHRNTPHQMSQPIHDVTAHHMTLHHIIKHFTTSNTYFTQHHVTFRIKVAQKNKIKPERTT